MYVSQNPEMKCRHPERDSGTALLWILCLYACLSLFPVCRMALKIVFPCLRVLYAMSLWPCDPNAKETKNGRQGQRLQDAVNKKSNSGTRSRSDSVSFCRPCMLCRMALGHISKFQVLYAKFRYLVTRLSYTEKGRQELGLWHLVHKKVNSGTWPKRDSA